MRVFFLIRSLERGGAERQLIELVRGLSATGDEVTVCTFYDGGALRGELQSIPGVTVHSLRKRGRWDVARVAVRLLRIVRSSHPDVIHSYMAFANELALLMGRAVGVAVVWGLRSSEVDPSLHDEFSRRQFAVGARLSRFADAIIVNSQAGKRHHERFGYSNRHMLVIPNGIDCSRFRPDRSLGENLRKEWGVRDGERLIGLVARINPVKDHKTFLHAVALVAKSQPKARFVCIGGGSQAEIAELKALGDRLGLAQRLIWAGARDDMSAAYNAIDILALSSISEGFPNVVAEAMASGKACVVTDVGDAAYIVGDCGVVVPPRDASALAGGLIRMLDTPEQEFETMRSRARARIEENFSIASLVSTTRIVLERTARRDHATRAP